MEMRQLSYFVRVAELASFTRAAEDLQLSQPSLSQSIARLEADLGRPLFERLGRGVALTDAGRELLERARQILSLAEEARLRIADPGEAGRIRVGAIPTVAPYFLPPLLRAFTRAWPRTTVEVHEEVTETAIKRCLAGELDLAILALPLDEEQLQVEPLYSEELLLVMPPGHPLSRKSRVAVRDIRDEWFVLLSEAHCLSEQVAGFCRRKLFQPVVTGRANQLATVQELVALGHGVSLIPQMAREIDKSRRRVYRRLQGQPPTRTLALAWRKHRYHTMAAQQFLAAVRAEAQSRRQGGGVAPPDA